MVRAELLVSFLLCISAVHAADHVVGGNLGWVDTAVDYIEWASGETFVAGDTLIFNYETIHDVVEVDKDGYDTCVVPDSTPSYTGGETIINLTLPGSRYFLCSISDHCSGGNMKLAITVEAGSTPPTPSPSSAPPSDIPQAPSPSDTPPSNVVPSPSPSGSNIPPSDLPPSPGPLELQPSDIPPTTSLKSPPPPAGGGAKSFGGLNSLLVGISLILVTLFSFMG